MVAAGRGGRARRALVASLAGLVAVAGLSPGPADAKKGKKRKAPAVTATATVPLLPGSAAAATANCPRKTHASGGGWSVAPTYSANGTDPLGDDTGTRVVHLQSQSSGKLSWTASVGAFTQPAVPGSLTSIARCERNALGKAVGGVSGTSTVPVGQGSTVDLNCLSGTHVLTAGFAVSPAGDLADPTAFRPIVVESRRIDVDTWRIHLVNPVGSPSPATLSTNVVCERNRKGLTVTEASAIAPVADNGRASAIAACTGKKHVVSGGFALFPLTGPAIGIDQSQPAGAKGWQVSLYEYPSFTLPAGSALAAYSYCKKNAIPRKKQSPKA